MRVFVRFLPCFFLLMLGQLPNAYSSSHEDNAEIEFFETTIRPLFAERCNSCHGPKKQEGGLRLNNRSGALTGGDNGPVISPGNPQESLLIRAVGYQSDLKMPPDGKLADEDIANLVRWVQNGAVWPGDEHSDVPESTGADPAAKDRLWSLQPVRDIPLPEIQDQGWPVSPIDHFILAALEHRGLKPSLPADKRTLLRRITFDLTGLPPTTDEIHEFRNDQSPTAFEKVVDRLLASPHYGERWGRHWLDVVRYADARDLIQLPVDSDFREAWRYRDWVVKAFNHDLPYDQFVELQIAGDLMQPADSARIDVDALVATGMLAIADFVPGDVDKEQMIADYVNDQIDVVGRAFMGMTIACARCHDHKFDPISTEDYYSLAGIFFSTRLIPGPVPGNTPLVRVPLLPAAEIKAIEAQSERDRKRLTELSRLVQTSSDREYVAYLERQLVTSLPRDLPLAIEYFHCARDANPPPLAQFAATRGADPEAIERWLTFLKRQPALSALNAMLQNDDPSSGSIPADATAIKELVDSLTVIADKRREHRNSDPIAKSLAESQVLQFRADDRSITIDALGQIVLWPDRAAIADDAIPVTNTPGPRMTTVRIRDTLWPVIRFDGNSMLQVPRSVPSTGSLFAVFRPDPNAAGTRLIGWEDSTVGQHGVGLMPTADGGLHAILRRAGASGDLVIPAPRTLDYQLISLTWGTGGVTCFRDGEEVGTNMTIDSVSSDPAITTLHIGGPGSGTGQQFRGDLCELQVYAEPLNEAARVCVENELRSRWLASPTEHTQTASNDPVADLYDELLSPRSPLWIESGKRLQAFPEEVRQRLAAENEELETLKNKPAIEIPRAVVVQDGGPPGTKHEGFHDAQVYIRGNPAKPGETVPRGFPKALAGVDPPKIQDGSGRRELARWLTHRSHPLTARVMVNRIWQHHFAEGLVRTSTNFGIRGERPSHPELLDYLARRFVESGWSVKAMHRLIMLSSVYQQSSDRTRNVFENQPTTEDSGQAEEGAHHLSQMSRDVDPENRLLSHMPRRRLEAEAIRDSLLAVSGMLDPALGGPGFLEISVPRRTLYLMSVRTGTKTADFNSLFDGPDGGGIIERRNQSIVAPQALFLLNDVWLDQVSAALAARLVRDAPENDEDRVRLLYETTLARTPTPAEMDIGLQLVADSSEDKLWVRYCRLILCSNEFIYID